VADAVPVTSNEFIEHQLTERLKCLEGIFRADALSLVSPLLGGSDDLVRTFIENRRIAHDSHNRLVALITTNGGSIELVHRIVDTIRTHYNHVSFIVPNYAYSAGTVLVMSGNDIYMD
jgi:ATP-dependent protease ClpP protease subunit